MESRGGSVKAPKGRRVFPSRDLEPKVLGALLLVAAFASGDVFGKIVLTR